MVTHWSSAYLLVNKDKIHLLYSSIYVHTISSLKYHCKSFLIGWIGNQRNTHRSLLQSQIHSCHYY